MTGSARAGSPAAVGRTRLRLAATFALLGAAAFGCGATSSSPPTTPAGASAPALSSAADRASSAGATPLPASNPNPGTSGPTGAAGSPGTLTVSLYGLSSKLVDQVRIRVESVTAHVDTIGWIVLSTTSVDVDLLQRGAGAPPIILAATALPPGTVTQVRLLLAASTADAATAGAVDYVVLPSGDAAPLEVPSGEQTGVKILGPFTIGACGATGVTLELDTDRSLWIHPTGGAERWILRPVIRPRTTVTAGTCPEGDTVVDPVPGEVGATCAADRDCISGTCTGGACAPAGPGGPCATGAECTSGACVAGSCAAGDAAGTGAACSLPSECMSNDCADGTCQPGAQGSACRTSTDCVETLRCVTVDSVASCAPPSY